MRFGVEMKELHPLEADHSKLKANFAGLRNQPLAAKSAFGCEMVSFMLRPTFWDFFALDIWCLNPQTLLATHQLQDSLVIKLEKRINNLKIFYYCNFHINISRELVLGTTQLLYNLQRKKNAELCSAFTFSFWLYFFTSQTSSEDVSSENEWLDF